MIIKQLYVFSLSSHAGFSSRDIRRFIPFHASPQSSLISLHTYTSITPRASLSSSSPKYHYFHPSIFPFFSI